MPAEIRVSKVGHGGAYFRSSKKNIKFINTGSKTLDMALGGGWAEDRVINIIGDKSTGKTLLCIEACANFANKYPKGIIDYREPESAFDEEYAEALGMPPDRVTFGEPLDTVEDLFEDLSISISKAKRQRKPCLYICDSLDSLSDRAELTRKMDEGSYGTQKAKNLSQLFRRIIRDLRDSHTTLFIVSQIRDRVGAMYGKKTTRSGGRALDFYASQIVDLAQIGRVVKTRGGIKRTTAIRIKAMISKNKIGNPYRDAEFKIVFGYGIDDVEACVLWMKQAKCLSDINVRSTEVKEYLAEVNAMSDQAYQKELTKLYAAFEKRWWDIESDFLPSRRKYGAVK